MPITTRTSTALLGECSETSREAAFARSEARHLGGRAAAADVKSSVHLSSSVAPDAQRVGSDRATAVGAIFIGSQQDYHGIMIW